MTLKMSERVCGGEAFLHRRNSQILTAISGKREIPVLRSLERSGKLFPAEEHLMC